MTAPTQMHLQFMGAIPGYVLGSMGAGSYTLTLATADHDFLPGSRLIVEVGGEAGAGARATVGVGGTWPENSFADEATLIASGAPGWTTDDGDPVAYAEDTGNVFRWTGAAWSDEYGGNSLEHSSAKYLPRALLAIVDAIDGATLTLDTPSVVATTNAKVWYDNHDVIEQALGSAAGSVRIPSDEQPYAVGSTVSTISSQADDCELFGDSNTTSLIYQPKGCQALEFALYYSDDVTVRDIGFERSWVEGACWNGIDGYAVWQPPIIIMYGNTSTTTFAERTSFLRLRLVDGVWTEVVLSLCRDGEIRECDVARSMPSRRYAGWSLQLSDCVTSGIYDSSFDSDSAGEAFELFKSEDCVISGATSRNGKFSSNSNANPVFDDIDLTITAGSGAARYAADPLFSALRLFSHNNNFLLATAEGGSLSNARLVVQGDPGGPGVDVIYLHHSALPAAGDPLTLGPGNVFTTNGHCTHAVNAEDTGSAVQDVDIDGLETDAIVEIAYGSVANTSAPELIYCPDHTTLGSGNDIDTITEECA